MDNPEFWSTLFEDHNAALLGRSRSVLGREPKAVVGVSADDVTQQVWVEVIDDALTYVGSPSQTRRFLQTREGWILSEVFREAKRRRNGMLKAELPEERAGPELAVNPLDEVEERLDDDRAITRGRAHFSCLTENERMVMIEFIEKGRPAQEVADDMEVTARWVRQLAVNAGRKLRQCLMEEHHA